MKNLIYLLITIAILSCSPPETESDICIDNMIGMLDMDHYGGAIENDCAYDYLLWFTYDGDDYFMIENPCADIVLHLWNCDKVDLCGDNNEECQTIFAGKADQGVIARSK